MFALWLAVAWFGSVAAQSAPQTSSPATSAKLSKDWTRLTIDDFEVVGNAPEKDLRRTLAEIENFRSTLEALVPGLVTCANAFRMGAGARRPELYGARDGGGGAEPARSC